jgi:hypothetical protein
VSWIRSLEVHVLFARLKGGVLMLKIIVVDSQTQRRLVLRGRMVGSGVDQFQRLWEEGLESRKDREFVIDLREVAAISQHAENILVEVMNRGASVITGAGIAKQVVENLSHRLRRRSASERSEGPTAKATSAAP